MNTFHVFTFLCDSHEPLLCIAKIFINFVNEIETI